MLTRVGTHLSCCLLGCVCADGVMVGTQSGSPRLDEGCSSSKSSTRLYYHPRSRSAEAQASSALQSQPRGDPRAASPRPQSPRSTPPQTPAPDSVPPPAPDSPASNAGRSQRRGCPSSVNTFLPAPTSPRTAPLEACGGGLFLSHAEHRQYKLSSASFSEPEEIYSVVGQICQSFAIGA